MNRPRTADPMPPPTGRRPGEPDAPDRPAEIEVETTLDHFEKLVAQVERAAMEAEQETGRHETTAQDTKRSLLKRVGIIISGSFVLLIGLALLALPGPGLVVVALGLGILASEVPFAYHLLEKVKKRLPTDDDGKLPKSAIAMMVAVTLVATVGSTWWALR